MRLSCPRCLHVLEYAHLAPRFCSNCGQPLSSHSPYQAATPTATTTPMGPAGDPQATVTFPGPQPRPSSQQPDTIGGYRLLRSLGAGGMGSVYEGEEMATGRRVAIKLIRAEFVESRDTVERFRREGRLASTILHPRCVFVFAADEDDGRPYIVMELMPGQTLGDLVERSGPLPVQEAVARILDVIEGLNEAHRTGVIHRDVKPSNCFLDSEGRVKVGDFGLAKSCLTGEQLTRSGGFLGTVLYAAPEQIRNDNVNHLADVYSVCATLYYLLTGRAPFHDHDPAAALARAVTDPVPSMRLFRADLPRTLDDVVMRGLARNRTARWQNLEDLRLALLPFLERPEPLTTVGWRATAYLLDLLVLIPLEMLVQALCGQFGWLAQGNTTAPLLFSLLVSLVCGLLYFAIPEWLWGFSPGKWITRLRVREVKTRDRPRLWRSGLRTGCFFVVKELSALAVGVPLWLLGVGLLRGADAPVALRVLSFVLLVAAMPFLSGGLGLLLLATTMRRRNAYRGLHELLSGTQVIRLLRAKPAILVPTRTLAETTGLLPAGVPTTIGMFQVRSMVRRDPDELLLQGEDTLLNRPVWLWLRRFQCESTARQAITRQSRPRWLAAGVEGDWQWDAYVASPGCLLIDLVAGKRRLSWPCTLSLLEQLAEELDAASQDDTLPCRLSASQLWIQPGGRLVLLDTPPWLATALATPMDLLKQTAALALEGKARPADRLNQPIHGPVPGPARDLLEGLMASQFSSLSAVREALAAAHDHPVDISPPGRALQLVLAAVGLLPGMLFMFFLGPVLLQGLYWVYAWEEAQCKRPPGGREVILASWSGFIREKVQSIEANNPDVTQGNAFQAIEDLGGFAGLSHEPFNDPGVALLLLFWPLMWALWAALSRGGMALRLAGIRLVGANGLPAARWRCAWRSFVVWIPVVLLLLLSLWLDLWRIASLGQDWSAEAVRLNGWVSWHCWWLAVLLPLAYVLAALCWPNRQLHDHLAGTYPVPR